MSPMHELAQQLNDLCEAVPFQTSWYLRDLKTGDEANRLGDTSVAAASTRKIAILAAALRAVHAGTLSLDQPVTIEAQYQGNFSGTFQHLQPGFTVQLRDLLVMMVIVSDNTSTGIVSDMLGLDAVNDLCQSVGMTGTIHRQRDKSRPLVDTAVVNATTANDMGRLLNRLLDGTESTEGAAVLGLTPELCSHAIDILSWQRMNDRMPAMLPAKTKVAHQPGTRVLNINDAGIVFSGNRPRFVLAVYTDNVPAQALDGLPGHYLAGQLIARLTRQCWDCLVVSNQPRAVANQIG